MGMRLLSSKDLHLHGTASVSLNKHPTSHHKGCVKMAKMNATADHCFVTGLSVQYTYHQQPQQELRLLTLHRPRP